MQRTELIESGIGIIGNLNVDLVMGPLDAIPTFGHEVFVPERSLRSAGAAFYTAAALAALGDPPRLLGAVGDDVLGQRIRDDVAAVGIDRRGVEVYSHQPTGLSVGFLDRQRDRAFVTHVGHLALFDVSAVMQKWDYIRGSRLVLFCGYNCLPGLRPDGGLALLQRAQSEGITTALDTGWDADNWEQGGRQHVSAMLAHTEVFLPNWEEARALTGLDDPATATEALLQAGPHTVIIKLGPHGAYGLHRDTAVSMPAIPTAVSDTVGAGDAFNAGVLYALARDWSMEAAMRLGTAVASYAISGHEPRYPDLQQARLLMEQLAQAP